MRMEYVREKQQAVRKWMVQSGKEANEYRSRTSNFMRTLENDVPLMIAQLGRMIDAIERYAEPNLVSASSPAVVSSSSGQQEVTDSGSTESVPVDTTISDAPVTEASPDIP